ncbi:MAG: hypothetical protein L3K11_05870 [Thermoplasmata archaeon]|nr:hypothetical protein [Thermoplasmata archaeon]
MEQEKGHAAGGIEHAFGQVSHVRELPPHRAELPLEPAAPQPDLRERSFEPLEPAVPLLSFLHAGEDGPDIHGRRIEGSLNEAFA